MILLDINVISEPLRRRPEARVVEWIDAQALETLYLSAITVADLRSGIALLPAGKRRTSLQENLERRVLPLFAGRVLPFDLSSAQAYAELIAKAQKTGLAIAADDGFIAAIAAANGFAVATKDASSFEAAGATVINPWGKAE
ncbi:MULTISPECIES: type II toxin-antitoxin system VapC family toxin [Halomonadaceae]|uniref:Ribonuclease VapC n=2 Tax=Vreelandella TaxID=3137766 RepID=A0A7Z0LT29_9GAMM|nr:MULTISPECIES: type II toxin-antitoxin system VapC family toxin [Halomonas]NYS78064.1 type II toxin-antitoxin system VapC family toxin [Halomonas glaciei]|tara:strand:- start:15493 stop:15918 length:426 start_codon:yes stop_codon:yes gene_type:complete